MGGKEGSMDPGAGAGGGRACNGDGAYSTGGPGGGDNFGTYVILGCPKNLYMMKGQKKADWHVPGENFSFCVTSAVCVPLSSDLTIFIEAVWAVCIGHGAPDAL